MSTQENEPEILQLATPANMRALAEAYHVIDGLSVQIVAYSLNDSIELTGDADDWRTSAAADDSPILDADGEPMYLAVRMSAEYTARLARRIGGPLS